MCRVGKRKAVISVYSNVRYLLVFVVYELVLWRVAVYSANSDEGNARSNVCFVG